MPPVLSVIISTNYNVILVIFGTSSFVSYGIHEVQSNSSLRLWSPNQFEASTFPPGNPQVSEWRSCPGGGEFEAELTSLSSRMHMFYR